jgi:hypothetical protein
MPLTLYPRRGRDISGVSADNSLATSYYIYGRKGEVIFFCPVPDTIRDVVAFPSVANTHYSKISSLVMLSWYFDLPDNFAVPVRIQLTRLQRLCAVVVQLVKLHFDCTQTEY